MPAKQTFSLSSLHQAILDSVSEQVGLLDTTGEILAVNRAWREFALNNGASLAAVNQTIGTNYLSVCQSSVSTDDCIDAAPVLTGIRAVLAGEMEIFQWEYPCHSPTEKRWFLLQATPLQAPWQGAVVTHLNITARHLLEDQLRASLHIAEEAKRLAEAANAAKDEFIAQVSHDLRSPLSTMLGWAKMLRASALDQSAREQAITAIIASGERQNRLIEDLLDTARLKGGKLQLLTERISLRPVIQAALDVMQPTWTAKQLVCHTDFRVVPGQDELLGDADRLEQVLWNLLSNAVKFTPAGGQIEVRLERLSEQLHLSLRDTGCGIAPDDLPFVFERYWQAKVTGEVRKGGLGLGLAMVKQLVEMHGGSITVESAGLGQGTTFHLSLPAVSPSTPPATGSTVPAAKRHTRLPVSDKLPANLFQDLHILVVDDEGAVCADIANVLRQQGATVQTAQSAASALVLLHEATPAYDLLITDLAMPGQDGYALLHMVRQLSLQQANHSGDDLGNSLPAIALTAPGQPRERIRVLQAGFQTHLSKPVEPLELTLVVANLLQRNLPETVTDEA